MANMEHFEALCQGITFKDTEKALHIVVDKTQARSPSKSGKTIIIGTTHGAARVNAQDMLSLNLYTKEGL